MSDEAPPPTPEQEQLLKKQLIDEMLLQIAAQGIRAYAHTQDSRMKAVVDACRAGLDVDTLLLQLASAQTQSASQPAPPTARQSQDAQREQYRAQQQDRLEKMYAKYERESERESKFQETLEQLAISLIKERFSANVGNDGGNSPRPNPSDSGNGVVPQL